MVEEVASISTVEIVEVLNLAVGERTVVAVALELHSRGHWTVEVVRLAELPVEVEQKKAAEEPKVVAEERHSKACVMLSEVLAVSSRAKVVEF